jgi:hypothetical protein
MKELFSHVTWVAPAFILLVVAWQSFNQPPTNRYSTTFLLFHVGLSLYYVMILVIWAFIVMIANRTGWTIIDIGAEKTNLAPIVGLVLVVMVNQASKTQAFEESRWLERARSLDEVARKLCLDLAAIPHQADQLAIELATSAGFHIPDEKTRNEVFKFIVPNYDRTVLNFGDDRSLEARFTRAVSLYICFLKPSLDGTIPSFETMNHGRSAYAKIMKANAREVALADSSFESLKQEARAFFIVEARKPDGEAQFRWKLAEFEMLICGLIARYALYQDKTSAQRQRRLARIGFTADAPVSSFGRDKWVASVLATTVLTFLLMTLSPYLRPLSPGQTILMAITFAVQVGLAIIGGATVARRFLQRPENRESNYPPLADLAVACLIVLGLSAVVRIFLPLLPGIFYPEDFTITLQDSLRSFADRWPALAYPVFGTFAIGLLCGYLGTSRLGRLHQAGIGAVVLALTFMLAGLVFLHAVQASTLSVVFTDPRAALWATMFNSAALGSIIGALVVASFDAASKSRQAEQAHRRQAFDASNLPSTVIGASRELGAYLRQNVQDLEGRYVCFRPGFTKPGINAYLTTIAWDEKQSCLTFRESARADSAHLQAGPVYVPYGKPFINLVTADQGAVRVIMVSRPDVAGIARGLMLTLSNPAGMHFTPATAPVVLRRLGEHTPELGFVQSGSPDYDLYQAELQSVLPDYGIAAPPPVVAPKQLVDRAEPAAKADTPGDHVGSVAE